MEQQKSNFDIFHYMGIVKRRKWFFIVPLVLIYVGFLVSSFLLPKVYQAKAIILIEEKKVVNPLLRNLAVSNSVSSRLGALREEILAWPRIFQLVERLELNKNINSPLELERLIANIRKNIKLNMKSPEVIVISYAGNEPQSTQELVNTLCDILINRNISLQSEGTESAIDFINEQLAIYKEKLEQSGTELREFKEIYGMGTLPGLEGTSPVGVTLNKINKELANLEAELVMASIDCTPEHPRIRSLQTRLESLKEKRNEYITEVAESTGVDSENYVRIADSLPRQQEELARLTRGKAIDERIYAMLLERLESAQITERLDNSENRTKFRIIEPARIPLIPIKPNKAKLNVLGIMMGGMMGFGFVYLLEYTDSSFSNEEQLKSAFRYPVLGTISKIVLEADIVKKKKTTSRMASFMFILILIMVAALIVFFKQGEILPRVYGFFYQLIHKIATRS